MDDLQHRRTLIPFSRLSRQHRHSFRHVARGLARRQGTDAIREDADPDAGAVDRVGGPRHVHLVGDVALRGVDLTGYWNVYGAGADERWEAFRQAARDRLVGGADRLNRVQLGQRLHRAQGKPGPNRPVPRHAVDHRASQGTDPVQDLGRHVRPDVHRHRLFQGICARSRPAAGLVRDNDPAGHPPRVQKLRAHLFLGGGPLCLRGQDGLNLLYGLRRQFPDGRLRFLSGTVRH